MLLLLKLATLIAAGSTSSSDSTLRPLYQWKTIDFNWTREMKQQKSDSKEYIPDHVSISGIAFYKDTMFLTIPRYLDGVPVTLATVSLLDYPEITEPASPLLNAFPSWELNAPGSCNALQSVSNMAIANGRAWILDVGRIETVTVSPINNCPPSLVFIDLDTTDYKIERYVFPRGVVDYNETYLTDLVVDGDYAYITDGHYEDPGLIVFQRGDSVKNSRSWKVRYQPFMKIQKEAEILTINGIRRPDIKQTIDGIALSPKIGTDEEKIVYFSPLSSLHLYAVSTKYLRDDRLSISADSGSSVYFRDIGTKKSQTDGMMMDSKGTLYFGLLGDSAIAAWHSGTNFTEHKIVGNVSRMNWIDRFGLDSNGTVYVVLNKIHLALTMKFTEEDSVNFAVWKMPTISDSTTPTFDSFCYILLLSIYLFF